MKPSFRLPLAVLCGLLLAAAFPKPGIAGLAWVVPALMTFAAGDTTGRARFKIGFVAGFTFWLSSLYWLLLIPVNRWEKFFPALGWLALSAFAALYHGAWLWLIRSPESLGDARPSWAARNRFALLGAAAWVGLEMLRARLLSGFPWNPLGASQYELTPLIHIASVTGVYGVSFLVVWTSLAFFNAATSIVREPKRRFAWQSEIILPLAVLCAVFVAGFSKLNQADDSDNERLRVLFVQPDISQRTIWNSAEDDSWFQGVIDLTERGLREPADLVLWPEAGTPKLLRYDETMRAAITNIAATHKTWMIIGSDDAEPARRPTSLNDVDYFNAGFLIDPDGGVAARYCKRNLVIFGEYVPLARWLPFLKWLTPISGGFEPGDRVVKFDLERPGTKPVRTAALICFEDIFPHLVRDYVDDDTDFLVNLTNNGWFGESAAQWQHAGAAVFRAVENGVPLLRCSNNGLTCWVDAQGRVRQLFRSETGSVYNAGVMHAEIPFGSTSSTFYRRHGDRFGWACTGLTLILAGLRSRTDKQKTGAA